MVKERRAGCQNGNDPQSSYYLTVHPHGDVLPVFTWVQDCQPSEWGERDECWGVRDECWGVRDECWGVRDECWV